MKVYAVFSSQRVGTLVRFMKAPRRSAGFLSDFFDEFRHVIDFFDEDHMKLGLMFFGHRHCYRQCAKGVLGAVIGT